MYISKVSIANFRSIKHAVIYPSKFNIFVGQNNHGKTNFFEAIDWFYTGSGISKDIMHLKDDKNEFFVEVEFSDVQAGIESVQNEKTKESFRKFADGRNIIKVIRNSTEASRRQLWDEKANEWTSRNFAGFDKSFNDCIPRLEYISTTTRLNDVSKWGKKTPIGLMLSSVLSVLLENNIKYKEFREKFDEVFGSEESEISVSLNEISGKVKVHLQEQFPDCADISFGISAPAFDDLLKNFETSINDGVETKAEDKGDGMQRALMLSIIKTYADYRRENDKLGKSFVFLIDEAELHLHPTAQRQLKNALLTLSEIGDQIFINTHSSVLITDDSPPQKVFKVVKNECVTDIKIVEQSEKPDLIYDLLGGSPSDLCLPNNFLIVEGRSECELLTRIIKRYYIDKPKIKIIFAGGDIERQNKSMDAINQVFTPLNQTPIYKDKLVILCDKPNDSRQADYIKFKKDNPHLEANRQIIELDVTSLEEYYPSKWKKKKAEVEKMSPRDKTKLSEDVGDSITRESFEKEMPLIFESLEVVWEKAHK